MATSVHGVDESGGVGHGPLSPYGVWGESGDGSGVLGSSISADGVLGESESGNGVAGVSPNTGVSGVGGALGVSAKSTGGVGLLAETDAYDFAVRATGGNAGVAAFNPGNDHAAYLASEYGHWFHGNVHVGGNLEKLGGGFKIDHPLHPADQYLVHSFVESPERKNVYDGVAEADLDGDAHVTLPEWFDTLNVALRYQLTPLGSPAPDLHISREFADGHFRISGARPLQRVSWQVTGVRDDPWARANPVAAEVDKGLGERGRYLTPELYGSDRDQRITHDAGRSTTPARRPVSTPSRSRVSPLTITEW